jgi:hypothetical protein
MIPIYPKLGEARGEPGDGCPAFGLDSEHGIGLASWLNEKDIYPLSLLEHFSTVGINEGNITGLLIPPHQIPDRRLKPVVVPKCTG